MGEQQPLADRGPAVFASDHPATVDAYLTALQDARAAGLRAIAAAEELGKNKGPAVRGGFWGMRAEIVGLFPDDPANPPEGWQHHKRTDLLYPRRGKPGDGARAWLADHQLPADPRVVLHNLGLPHNGRKPGRDGFILSKPQLVVHDGTLWAYYGERSVPDGDCTWQPRKLSEFYAALEAEQEIAAKQEAERKEAAGG